MKVDTKEVRGGVRIHVCDDDTDSLAVFDVVRLPVPTWETDSVSQIVVRARLRGNLDAHKRPVKMGESLMMDAPLVSEAERYQRKLDYVRRWGSRMTLDQRARFLRNTPLSDNEISGARERHGFEGDDS